jgi:hypothetical protein
MILWELLLPPHVIAFTGEDKQLLFLSLFVSINQDLQFNNDHFVRGI